MKKSFYSHGKLLLSGEYTVLDGATAMALPTRLGQWLHVVETDTEGLEWSSKNPDGAPWFTALFQREDFTERAPETAFPSGIRERLLYLLRAAVRLNPEFAKKLMGVRVETHLEFPREWGLGSSSTLISNLGLWAGTDPYDLLAATLGGSGYDIAAARSSGPFFYTLRGGNAPLVHPMPFDPVFAGDLFFVYLNQKQDSREGIARYRQRPAPSTEVLKTVSGLSLQLANASDLPAFRQALDAHEALLGEILEMEPIKNRWFPDYPGSIKSLGAWGGDFILATGSSQDQDYFRQKGYSIVRPYREFIL
ncbi:MAG: GYDIA family GHMP kinase [Robiginitalea sp.]|uniref:GYDIA family GHMP kinase n=1 Tax=Robiginitalea sp. TaxID=1902411 RepID=UPI003C765C79